MKLTRHGRDYIVAVLLTAAVGLVSGEGLFAGLSLSMALASVASLLLLRVRMPRSTVEGAGRRTRVIKGEEGKLSLTVRGLRGRWSSGKVESVTFDTPMESEADGAGGDDFAVRFFPSQAGRFTALEANLVLRDALELFSADRRLPLSGTVVESLPLSLVGPPQRVYVPPLVVGESPAGTSGKGQEFYGIEEYTERSESRDILWKRAAREPGRPLLARIREANSPDAVELRVVHGLIPDGMRAALVDLQCEALGALGRALLFSGVRPAIVGPDGSELLVTDEDQLADAVMSVSAASQGAGAHGPRSGRPVVLLSVGTHAEGPDLRPAQPTVFIGDERPHISGRYEVSFTGREDLMMIVGAVLGA